MSKLQAVNLKSPSVKKLVPGFYREMKMLSRMKAWLKIGDLHGYRLDEQLRLEEASLSGYFELEEE